MSKSSTTRKIFFLLCVVVIVFSYFHNMQDQWIQDDEQSWSWRGLVLFQEYATLDFSSPVWETHVAYDQPTFAEFLFGAFSTAVYRTNWNVLLSKAKSTETEAFPYWSNYEPDNWFMPYRYIPYPFRVVPKQNHAELSYIVMNRYVATFFGVASLILVFGVGTIAFGYWTGLIGMVLLSQNPVFYAHSRHALLETPFVFFELLSLYVFLAITTKPAYRSFRWFIVFGLVLSMVAGTKINGFMYIPIAFGSLFILYVFRYLSADRALLLLKGMTLSAVVALLFFYILNPFIWKNPIAGMRFMYNWRQHETLGLAKGYPKFSYPAIGSRPAMILEQTMMKEGCCSNLSRFVRYADAALFLLGAWSVVKRKRIPAAASVFCVWMVATYGAMVLYLSISFDKYLFPIIPFITLMEALGVYYGLDMLISGIRRLGATRYV